MQDFKFNINKHVHWKKDFDDISFIDRGEWKAKEGVFRDRYWQFECADADGKLVTLNANPAGINQFIEQLLNFNLPSYAHPAEFVMHQEIEHRKCLEGEAYKAFDDGISVNSYPLISPNSRQTARQEIPIDQVAGTLDRVAVGEAVLAPRVHFRTTSTRIT